MAPIFPNSTRVYFHVLSERQIFGSYTIRQCHFHCNLYLSARNIEISLGYANLVNFNISSSFLSCIYKLSAAYKSSSVKASYSYLANKTIFEFNNVLLTAFLYDSIMEMMLKLSLVQVKNKITLKWFRNIALGRIPS